MIDITFFGKFLIFSDIHFHHTHRFSHITPDGYTVRELEHLSCADDLIKLAEEHDIEAFICLGDLWGPVGDNMSAQTLAVLCEFIDKLRKVKPVLIIVGNHDLSANTNNHHIHKLNVFEYWDNVKVYSTPTVEGNFVFMPYCTSHEYATNFLEAIENKEEKIVFSHLELKGISFNNGIETTKGVALDLLDKFKLVLQGHYHSGTGYGSKIKVIGSTQRLSFKDHGKSRDNIVLFDSINNKIKRYSFNCPDWLVFTDDNISDVLTTPVNNYVKVDITTDLLLTPEIQNRLESFKGKEIHIDLTRLHFNKKSSADIVEQTEDDVSVIKQFIEKTENTTEHKELLLKEGIRLLDKVKV